MAQIHESYIMVMVMMIMISNSPTEEQEVPDGGSFQVFVQVNPLNNELNPICQ